MSKDTELVHKAISKTKEHQLFYTLIPVSWGLWNIGASVLSIIAPPGYIALIWAVLMGGGLLSQFGLYSYYKRKAGFILKSVSDVGKVWMVIMLGLFILMYPVRMMTDNMYADLFLALVAVMCGMGLSITGILVKSHSITASGILWIFSAVLHAVYSEDTFLIHLVMVSIILILFPAIKYIVCKGKSDD